MTTPPLPISEAIALMEEAIRTEPENPENWALLVHCWYTLGDWERALDVIETARSNRLSHPDIGTLESAMRGRPDGTKVFCIGRNKTGTTTMEHALRAMGYRMGWQPRGEMLLRDWAKRDFRRIVDLCNTADAFQDLPFSADYTFQAVDAAFPGSKFILTVRDNPEQWFASLVRFHTQIVGKGRIPTTDDLRDFPYRYPGFLLEAMQAIYGDKLYDEEVYIADYVAYNRRVAEYFRHRPDDLLVLNVSAPDAMERLCVFLGRKYEGQQMPHLNRSG